MNHTVMACLGDKHLNVTDWSCVLLQLFDLKYPIKILLLSFPHTTLYFKAEILIQMKQIVLLRWIEIDVDNNMFSLKSDISKKFGACLIIEC